MLQTLPSPLFYRALAILLLAPSGVLLSMSYTTITTPSPQTMSWGLFSVGVFLVAFGLLFPARIVLGGAILPPEIKQFVSRLAFLLPLVGVTLGIGAMVTHPSVRSLSFALTSLFICWLAFAALWRLSLSLPWTFYMGEMVSIFVSTGAWGAKDDSIAHQEFIQWTKGRVAGVPVGEKAPDGEVITLDGERKQLSSYFEKSDRPFVLNFGSYSCPHHRKRMGELHELFNRWKDRGVDFLTVYTAEAHPEDRWRLDNQYAQDEEYTGNPEDFCFYSTKTIDEHKEMARWLQDKKDLQLPLVVDSMDNTLLYAYNSWPIRLYIIHHGKIVFSGKQGPFGYAPNELHDTLEALCT